MQPSLPRLAFLAFLGLLLTVASGVQAQTPMELPPLPGDTESEAIWINDRGDVGGNSFGSDGSVTGVVWDKYGIPTPLPPLSGDNSTRVGRFFAGVSGNVINNKGEIVGTSFGDRQVGVARAVVWDRNGTILRVMQPVNPVGTDINTIGGAISANGRVVGTSFTDLNPTGVVWDQGGNPTVLLNTDCQRGFYELRSINARSEVTGPCNGIFDSGSVWDRKGEASDLPPLPGFVSSHSNSINARGDVAGFSFVGQDAMDTATVWDHKHSPRPLPTLPGDVRSMANGINDQGEVVGVSVDDNRVGTAVVWDRDGNATALPPLPGDAQSVGIGISRRSVVVGHSIDSSGNRTAVVWR